ncbi:PTS sugar transporter subunit IIA [Levilactobacillus lindianensis]|uniref:PTS sugar transporter subunit IIA n=1 Tax=Levilactobacillus lindianensis TaxID=2486018 RepID=UPI000F74B10C|nr:PTS sugar transporter subunit IIA [Levilactobacillus lindianensis]
MKDGQETQAVLVKRHLTKQQLFNRVCQALGDRALITEPEVAAAALEERERLAETLITESVAMPHCQSDVVKQSKILLVNCKRYPITWDAAGHQVEGLVILLLAKDAPQDQLLRITDFVRQLADNDVADSLFETEPTAADSIEI